MRTMPSLLVVGGGLFGSQAAAYARSKGIEALVFDAALHGAALVVAGEREGRIRPLGPGRQALAFVRDAGSTYFSDGTAERAYTAEHDRATLARAAAQGLTEPVQRYWGRRPYTPGGPVFQKIGTRTWLATGGRKLGTLLGASYARRLVEELQ